MQSLCEGESTPTSKPPQAPATKNFYRLAALDEALRNASQVAQFYATEKPDSRCVIAAAQLRLLLERISRGYSAGIDSMWNLVELCAAQTAERRPAP